MNTLTKKAVKVPTKAAKVADVKTKELKAPTLNKSTKKVVKAKTKDVNFKGLTSDELFLRVLEQMGKPSLVRDMVTTIKKSKLVSTAKGKLLAKLYASASHLNRDGKIKRKPVNKSMFIYGLANWKFTKAKVAA